MASRLAPALRASSRRDSTWLYAAPASAHTTTSSSGFSASRIRRVSTSRRRGTTSRSTLTSPSGPKVTLKLRSSSAARVCASGSWMRRSVAVIIGAVTSRMMTSTSDTSMIGTTLGLVMISDPGFALRRRRRIIAPPHDGDLAGAALFRLVQHLDERAVFDVRRADDNDRSGAGRRDERPQVTAEFLARHDFAVHDHLVLGIDRDHDAFLDRRHRSRRLRSGLLQHD